MKKIFLYTIYMLIFSMTPLFHTMYQVCHHDSAAMVAYQDAFERLEKLEGHTLFRIKLLSYKIEMQLALGNLDDAEIEIGKYEYLLKLRKIKNANKGILHDTDWYEWMLHSFYANLYLHKNQLDKADKALSKASTYYLADSPVLEFATYYYLYVKAHYLKTIHKYDEALSTINIILDRTQDTDDMNLKADILIETRRFKEAVSLYSAIDKISKSNNNEGLIHPFEIPKLIPES